MAEESSHSFPIVPGVNYLDSGLLGSILGSPARVLGVKQNEVSLVLWNFSGSPVVFQGPESNFLNP